MSWRLHKEFLFTQRNQGSLNDNVMNDKQWAFLEIVEKDKQLLSFVRDTVTRYHGKYNWAGIDYRERARILLLMASFSKKETITQYRLDEHFLSYFSI